MSLEQNIRDALEKIGEYYVVELKNKLAADDNVASRDLINSISSKPISQEAVVITANRYLEALSDGKKATSKGPSPEMVSRITSWMKFRGLRPRNGGLTPSSYKSASFVIARRINKTGWAGSSVIQRSFKAIEDKIDIEITNAFKKELDRIIEDINKKQKK